MNENTQKTRKASHTQYDIFETCELQYKLKYVDKLAPEDQSIELIFGTAMHETIQDWLRRRFEDEKRAKRMDFSTTLKENMVKEFKNMTITTENGLQYPCTKEQLQEYYEDGVSILEHVYKYANEFFPVKNFELVGIEIPLDVKLKGNLHLSSYLDIVLKDTKENKIHIIDIKTSRAGWTWQKNEDKKVNQILIYKKYYSEVFNIPPENILPYFIILKRKIFEESQFPIKRLSKFSPSHGKISMARAMKSWQKFIDEAFTDDGERNIERTYKPSPSPNNCRFCPFKNNENLCSVSYYLNKKD